MATPVPIASQNDWKVSNTGTEADWVMNQNEPLGALSKRIRWSIPADAVVRIGFPERVPGTGPTYTEPFRIGDVFPPVPGALNSEPVLMIPIDQRELEWWMFAPSTP